MPKSFYIETFGCQMNVHDSEKVAGTLLNSGYRQVDNADDAVGSFASQAQYGCTATQRTT